MEYRVRFAPSPTGALHIGGLRTALYNYLFAKQNGGKFIVRIEDTDSERFVPGAEEYIMESLKWCGIVSDEGIGIGGPYAPYRQSERRHIYKKYAEELIGREKAYYAFDSAENLNTLRKEAENKGEVFAYNYEIRKILKNSLNLTPQETKAKIESGEPYVIRFKTPENENIKMNDDIRGEMQVNTSVLDDKVLYKSSDELPTYHLANIVDDHLMEITHVIRGEEWLPSLPLHFLLYQAFGWEKTMPKFAHLPLLLKPQGQGKLSKRDGDKFGFPVFPLEWKDPKTGEKSKGYREEGYFPQALINILSLLGWNPGTEQEIFTIEELIEVFSIEKVNKSGSRFNPDKAKWFNAQYLKQKSNAELGHIIIEKLKETYPQEDINLKEAEYIASLFKERVNFPSEIIEWAKILFERPCQYEQSGVQKFAKKELKAALVQVLDFMRENKERLYNNSNMEELALHLEQETIGYIKANNFALGQVMSLFRLLLIGNAQGPNVYPICAFIGFDEVEKRLSQSCNICS